MRVWCLLFCCLLFVTMTSCRQAKPNEPDDTGTTTTTTVDTATPPITNTIALAEDSERLVIAKLSDSPVCKGTVDKTGIHQVLTLLKTIPMTERTIIPVHGWDLSLRFDTNTQEITDDIVFLFSSKEGIVNVNGVQYEVKQDDFTNLQTRLLTIYKEYPQAERAYLEVMQESSSYTHQELVVLPADQLLDIFLKNGLVLNGQLKERFTEEEMASLFKREFGNLSQGVILRSDSMYFGLAEQTSCIYAKIIR